jgi:addiction module HigA family antidote
MAFKDKEIQRGEVKREPTHPGLILLDMVNNAGWTLEKLSDKTGIDQYRLNRLMATESDFTRQDAQSLSEVFGTSEAFWMRLQKRFDEYEEDDGLES